MKPLRLFEHELAHQQCSKGTDVGYQQLDGQRQYSKMMAVGYQQADVHRQCSKRKIVGHQQLEATSWDLVIEILMVSELKIFRDR